MVGSDFWRSSGPTPLLGAGWAGQFCFEFLKEWRFHDVPAPPFLVLGHHHGIFFLSLKLNVLFFSLGLLSLVAGYLWEESAFAFVCMHGKRNYQQCEILDVW